MHTETVCLHEQQEEKRRVIMAQPVGKLICRMAVPTIVTMMISALYNFTDTYFVSGISDSATAIVGIVYALVCLTQAVGYFWGQGSANYISRKLGSGCTHDAQNMAQTGFLCSLASGLLIMALGLLLLTPLCRILGAPQKILLETCTYCGIILLGSPFVTASLAMNCQYRFQGNATSSMLGISVGAVLNIGLDPLMIHTFGWGIEGAAWATVISQAISFFVLFWQSRHRGNIPLHFRFSKIGWKTLAHICPGGMPSLWRQGLLSVSMAYLNTISKPYGVAAVAAMSVVAKIMSLCIAFATGFGQGFQPVCGMNYGAGNYLRVRRAYRFTLLVAFCLDVVIAASCGIFAPQIIALFSKAADSEVLDYGIAALRYQCVTFPLTSFLLITNMMVQTMGKMFSGTLLAVARNGLFFIPIAALLVHRLGFFGIQLAQPCADICAFLCTIFVWLASCRELKGKCSANCKGRGA